MTSVQNYGVALQNKMNGTNGHTALGVFLVGNIGNMFGLATAALSGTGEKDVIGPDTETENYNVTESQNQISSFNDALHKFVSNKNKDTATALKKAYDENPKNRTIEKYYNRYKDDVEKYLNNKKSA